MSDRSGARLTTHVLDTSLGKPARGIEIELRRLSPAGQAVSVATATTNADGRCDVPLMEGDGFEIGRYELVFAAGPYLEATGQGSAEPRFLDEVVVRFGVSDYAHHHVPLLLSPYGYSTYRGS